MGIRPKTSAPVSNNAPDSDIEFIDKLVRQSLAINPALRGDDSTTAFLKRMRDAAVGVGRTDKPQHAKPAVASAEPSAEERRAGTIALFMRQKQDDFEKEAAGLRFRESELARDKAAAKERHVKEVVDFLVVVFSSVPGGAPADSLKGCRVLLSELGITDAEVLRRVREAKK